MELPNETENLFIEEKSFETGSWISNPANYFYLYSEGYKLAGDLVYNGMKSNLKNNNLFCFLIPLFIYLIVGFFAFKIPGIKEVSIFLSLLIIIFLLYFLIKKFKRNQMI